MLAAQGYPTQIFDVLSLGPSTVIVGSFLDKLVTEYSDVVHHRWLEVAQRLWRELRIVQSAFTAVKRFVDDCDDVFTSCDV